MKIMMLTGKHAKKLTDGIASEYEDIFDEIEEVLLDMPHTWHKYKDKEDGADSIISMEIEELNKAKEKSSFYEQKKEYLHVAAAVIHALHCIEKHK